eukprot:1807703-Prymnesium_polylepis.1
MERATPAPLRTQAAQATYETLLELALGPCRGFGNHLGCYLPSHHRPASGRPGPMPTPMPNHPIAQPTLR